MLIFNIIILKQTTQVTKITQLIQHKYKITTPIIQLIKMKSRVN